MDYSPTQYLTVYPVAVKLWMDGKYNEAAIAVGKSPAQIGGGNDKKAYHFGMERQKVVNESQDAIQHNNETDELARLARQISGHNAFDQSKAYNCLINKIYNRRDEWQKLYGVAHAESKKRLRAMKLKKFVRKMRLMEKNYSK